MTRIARWGLMGVAVGVMLFALWFLWSLWTLARPSAEPPARRLSEGRPVPGRAPEPAQVAQREGPPPAAAELPGRPPAPPPPRKSPRQLLIEAEASGSAEAAYLAAKGLFSCKAMEGVGQRARETLLHSGKALPGGGRADALFSGLDRVERECQELDDAMKAQYEPLLRQAMAGGVPGAAAKWWVTPEGRAVVDASTQPQALSLLRRDALACDKNTLVAYQVMAVKHRDSFPAHEAHAVSAAAEALEKAGQLRGNAGLRKVMEFLPATYRLPEFLAGDDFKSTKTQILAACEASAAARTRRP
ncbi:hypothetical protein IP87_05680 [beta proteobacterium AAP121]|nr:hypothetical protein IP80_07380 [beta proteobacterium AAP65]KPF99417.1 hypothetical protein IP87_05680 [beta proteobacterium AAP121]